MHHLEFDANLLQQAITHYLFYSFVSPVNFEQALIPLRLGSISLGSPIIEIFELSITTILSAIFKILTLFPESIKSYTDSSIIGRAQKDGYIDIEYLNIRDYSKDKHRKVDDTPYGGGFGMVMTPQPFLDCHKAARENLSGKTLTVYMSPAGAKFDHSMALELKEYDNLILMCGHYEGIDQRIIDSVVDKEISIGDFVLTGGELACAVVVDAVTRLIDGVLPDNECYNNESIASGLLEYPQYTKPATYEGLVVPEVLTGGNHKAITEWQRRKSLEKTLKNRPDLLESAVLTKEDVLYLETLNLK